MALRGLGGVCYLQNELTRAAALFRQALAAFNNVGNGRMVADCLERLAATFAAAGRGAPALRLAGAATTLREHTGAPLSGLRRAALDRRLAPARQQESVAAAEAAWHAGRLLTRQQALAEALAEEPAGVGRFDARRRTNGLTAREQEVVALIAQGRRNHEIAESLVITDATAHRHVANILDKLGLHTRSQIAVWATEHGLSGKC
jgi:DNA-binding CsgD family transcriptional regulator